MSAPLPRPLMRGERERLPTRRAHETHSLRVGQTKIKIQVGTRPDGSVCELFVRLYREGAPFRAMLNSYARAISCALQHGVPLAELVSDLQEESFEPCGAVNGHDVIREARSLLDAIAQVLATYPGGQKRAPALAPARAEPLSPADVLRLVTGSAGRTEAPPCG